MAPEWQICKMDQNSASPKQNNSQYPARIPLIGRSLFTSTPNIEKIIFLIPDWIDNERDRRATWLKEKLPKLLFYKIFLVLLRIHFPRFFYLPIIFTIIFTIFLSSLSILNEQIAEILE